MENLGILGSTVEGREAHGVGTVGICVPSPHHASASCHTQSKCFSQCTICRPPPIPIFKRPYRTYGALVCSVFAIKLLETGSLREDAGDGKWEWPFGKTIWWFLRKLKRELPQVPASPLVSIYIRDTTAGTKQMFTPQPPPPCSESHLREPPKLPDSSRCGKTKRDRSIQWNITQP